MNNKDFWKNHYQNHSFREQSSFAKFALPHIDGPLVELGCGDGRDLYYFVTSGIPAHGVDMATDDTLIIKQDVGAYIKQNDAPRNVYTRFFWHAIPRDLQLQILDWVSGRIFIEARTTKDKPKNLFGRHARVLIDVERLKKDLTSRGFTITHLEEGYGFSPYKGEDPHLVRVIAEKTPVV